MAILGIDNLPSYEAGVRGEMLVGRDNYKPTATPFLTLVESTLPAESYAIHGEHAGPREFKGETTFTQLREEDYLLPNKEYFDAMSIAFNRIKYDQTGRIYQTARDFGYEWERGKDKMAIETLGFGASNNCYDGTPFFGASHVWGDSGVQSNIFTGASPFSATTFQVHAAAMSAFKSDRGEVMGRKATHVIVQRNSVSAVNARQLANSTFTTAANGSMAANPWSGMFEVIEVDYLPSAVQFVVADLSGSNKPIIAQIAGDEIFTAQEGDSEWFQTHKEYRYAVFQDWAHGYNDWTLATMQI